MGVALSFEFLQTWRTFSEVSSPSRSVLLSLPSFCLFFVLHCLYSFLPFLSLAVLTDFVWNPQIFGQWWIWWIMMDQDGKRWNIMKHYGTLYMMEKTWTNDYGGYMLQGSQKRLKSGWFDVVNAIIFSLTTIFVGLCSLLIYGLLVPESLGLPGNPGGWPPKSSSEPRRSRRRNWSPSNHWSHVFSATKKSRDWPPVKRALTTKNGDSTNKKWLL